MTAGKRGGTGSIAVSMDVVETSTTSRANSAASGLMSVTVHGAGLGLAAFTAVGRSGQTGCEDTGWESETSVRCLLSSLHLGTRGIVVTVGSLVGSLSMSLSIDAVSIYSLGRSIALNLLNEGGQLLTVTGSWANSMSA